MSRDSLSPDIFCLAWPDRGISERIVLSRRYPGAWGCGVGQGTGSLVQRYTLVHIPGSRPLTNINSSDETIDSHERNRLCIKRCYSNLKSATMGVGARIYMYLLYTCGVEQRNQERSNLMQSFFSLLDIKRTKTPLT